MLRTEHPDAAPLQYLAIGLHRRVRPHDMIHGGGDDDGCSRRQTQGREKIGCGACRNARHEFRSGRGDQNKVGPTCQLDMAHGRFSFPVPETLADRKARHGLKSGFRNELLCRVSHHHLHRGTVFTEPPYEFRCFVGGDAAGHTENYVLLCHGASSLRPDPQLSPSLGDISSK